MTDKTYKSKKIKKKPSKIKTINIFLSILLIASTIATASYFLMKKDSIEKKENNILETTEKKDKDTIKPVIIEPKVVETPKNNIKEKVEDTSKIKSDKFDEYPNDDKNEENDNKSKIKDDENKKEDKEKVDTKVENIQNNTTSSVQEIIKKNIEELEKDKAKELQRAKELENKNNSLPTETKTENKTPQTKIEETKNKKQAYDEITEDKSSNIETKENNNTEAYNSNGKPKLAIVIDDVTTTYQKNRILSMGYKVNMAFLPPTRGHKNSAKIALDLPFYMIHFPMQASKAFKGEEENTLYTTDSYEKIEARVKQLREWYPNAIYTNNHTGSVFTGNDEAMGKLFQALKKYNFIFVDSKTASKSYAKKYAEMYNMPHISRTTFLDNKIEYSYIKKQLLEAIKTAKKKGKALAIGHPHEATFKVLRDAKELFDGVEIVYVNELQ